MRWLGTWLLIGLLAPGIAHANAGDLELGVSLPKRTFVVGEPVAAVCTVRNRSSRPVELSDPFDYEWALQVMITRPDGSTFLYVSPLHAFGMEARRAVPAPWRLAPGESKELNEWISFHVPARDFAMPQPGKYLVAARYPYERGASSAPVAVHVVAPTGNDKAAFGYIVKQGLKALLTPHARRVGATDEQIVALMELASSGKCVVGSCSPGMFDLGPNRYARGAALALKSLGHSVEVIDLPLPPLPEPSSPPAGAAAEPAGPGLAMLRLARGLARGALVGVSGWCLPLLVVAVVFAAEL